MAQPGDTTGGQARRAKARLSGMLTEAVGIVDKAANGEEFLVVKRAEMGDAAGAETGVQKTAKAEGDAGAAAAATDVATAGSGAAQAQKAPMKLPAAAKEAMLTGLSGALEKLSAVADMVNGAEVDDAAPVPPELGQALGEVAAILTGLGGGGEMNAAGDAAAAAGSTGVEKAELDAYTAMHATIDAARCRLWQASDSISKDPAKAAEEIRAVADMLASAVAMVPTAAAKAVAGAVAKSGRKMSKGRLNLFKQAFDIMATLLKELEDEGEEAAAAAGAAAQAAATQTATTAATGPLAKALDALSSFEPMKLVASIGEVLSVAKGLQTSIASLGAKVQAHDIALAKAAKSVALPNSNPVEGAHVPSAKTPHAWCDDLAAKAREEIDASKGNGK